MGTSGIPVNLKDVDIIDVLATTRGNVAEASRIFGCTRDIVYDAINRNPVLKTYLDKVRNYNIECMLTMAENVVENRMKQEEDNPRLALDAAKFVIEKQGHRRKWEGSARDDTEEKAKTHLEDLKTAAYEAVAILKQEREKE